LVGDDLRIPAGDRGPVPALRPGHCPRRSVALMPVVTFLAVAVERLAPFDSLPTPSGGSSANVQPVVGAAAALCPAPADRAGVGRRGAERDVPQAGAHGHPQRALPVPAVYVIIMDNLVQFPGPTQGRGPPRPDSGAVSLNGSIRLAACHAVVRGTPGPPSAASASADRGPAVGGTGPLRPSPRPPAPMCRASRRPPRRRAAAPPRAAGRRSAPAVPPPGGVRAAARRPGRPVVRASGHANATASVGCPAGVWARRSTDQAAGVAALPGLRVFRLAGWRDATHSTRWATM